MNRDGGQIVSWVEPVVAGDTELLLRTNSNCETLELNEMMSNVQQGCDASHNGSHLW